MVETVHEFTSCAVLDTANPALYAYPSDKRRTRETVAQMRLAEKRLDKFWAIVDNHCEVHTSYSTPQLLMVRVKRVPDCRSICIDLSKGLLQRLEPKDPQNQALGRTEGE